MTTSSLRVGIDLVQVSRIEESLARFGDRFLQRVFTSDEIAYATSATPHTASRLAARFAAKEATIKALGLVEHASPWRDIEVRRAASGACAIELHKGPSPCRLLAEIKCIEANFKKASLVSMDRSSN